MTDDHLYPDRSALPPLPDWAKGFSFPDLQLTGPTSYPVGMVEQWFAPNQSMNGALGSGILRHLVTTGEIVLHLSLADLYAIQAKGVDFFEKHFSGKVVFAWKSVAASKGIEQGVPYLMNRHNALVIDWVWVDAESWRLIGGPWKMNGPALRFAPSQTAQGVVSTTPIAIPNSGHYSPIDPPDDSIKRIFSAAAMGALVALLWYIW